jgi:DNA modification methylase
VSVQLLVGDALETLRTLPDESVDMCVTSPPYWGLRDYGVEGQLGMEPTLGEHLDNLVEVFAEVWRVLKPHGSLWLNYGDCYATSPNGKSAAETKADGNDDRTFRDKPFSTVGPVYGASSGSDRPGAPANGSKRRGGGNNPAGPILVHDYAKTTRGNWNDKDSRITRNEGTARVVAGGYLKPKDLCMIPNRLAIALQDAGWWVRSEIIWGKPSAMPDSSGVYRPSVAHEKIFLLTKGGGDVYRARDTGEIRFDPDLSERCPLVTKPDETGPRWINIETYYDAVSVRMPPAEASEKRWAQDIANQAGSRPAIGAARADRPMKAVGGGAKQPRADKQRGHSLRHQGFNERWDDMPREEQRGNGRLLRNYEPDLRPIIPPEVWEIATAAYGGEHFATFPTALVAPCIMAGCPKGGTVLDPFGGVGTTGLVAVALGRNAILIELSPKYAEMARERLKSRNPRHRPADPATAGGLLLAMTEPPPQQEAAE